MDTAPTPKIIRKIMEADAKTEPKGEDVSVRRQSIRNMSDNHVLGISYEIQFVQSFTR